MQRGVIGVVGLVVIVIVTWGVVRLASTEPAQGRAVSPTFTDVAPSAGVANMGWAHGVAWGDYDNDGDLDIFLANLNGLNRANLNGLNRLYRNEGHDEFTDVMVSAGVVNEGATGNGVAWGDYDNDGGLDLYVVNGSASRLYRNNGNGTFTDVAPYAGVTSPGRWESMAWGDYDNDGDLDMYVSNWGSASRLYRNNGNGTFTDVAPYAGVTNNREGRGVAWGDYDNDGDLDLYVTNVRGANRLYRNNGDGTFTDVAPSVGVDNPSDEYNAVTWGKGWGSGRAVAWGDYDNDGDLDIYMGNVFTANRLYRNNGDGTFTDVAPTAGVADRGVPGVSDVAWGDYDNDGDLDLYVVREQDVSRLYQNEGNGHFLEMAATAGVANQSLGSDVAWGDYDNDGDLDVYVGNLGRPNRLYRNEGTSNRWLIVTLVGTVSNRSGIGAVVTAVIGPTRQRRDVDGGSGYGSQPSLPVEFGFGTTATVDSLIIRWPSGIVQVLTHVATDQVLTVTEAPVLPPTQLALTFLPLVGKATLVNQHLTVPASTTLILMTRGITAEGRTVSVTPIWRMVGEIGTITPAGRFTAGTQVGAQGRLVVTAGHLQETLTVMILPFQPIRLTISLRPLTGKATLGDKLLTVAAGATLTLETQGIAPDGRLLAVTPTWRVVGAIGTIDPQTGYVTAGTKAPMEGRLIVTASDLQETLQVRLQPGPLRQITILPATVTLKPGRIQVFRATGIDMFNNTFPLRPMWHPGPLWYTVGGIGTIDKRTGVFTAGTKAGTGYVIAYADSIFGDTGTRLQGSAKVVVAEQELPNTYTVSQNYPNPFNPTTTIHYELPDVADVHLIIYDLTGQPIRTLVRGYQQPGEYTVVWDGTDAAGRKVASGIYFYRLEAVDRGFVETRKMLLLR